MNSDDPLLLQELRRDEGVKYEPYKDTEDIWTVGVGHNLKAHPLPVGWSYPLSDLQVNTLLAEDLVSDFTDLDTNFPWWRKMTYVRQRVIANMMFNLGYIRLSGFVNTLKAMEEGRYEYAASGMLASKWAKQVGDRAKRLAQMMRGG